jgi:hypothetical protein
MTRKFAASRVGPGTKSRTEDRWLQEGKAQVEQLYGQPVLWEMYEPFKLKLGLTWYRVDFGYLLADGRLVLVETKQNQFQANYRDSITRVRMAQGQFFFFDFVVAHPNPKKSGGGWKLERLADKLYETQESDR